MSRRMKNHKRVIGLSYGNLCPHCRCQVDHVQYLLPGTMYGYIVSHLWNNKLCENTFGYSDFSVDPIRRPSQK